MKFSDMFRLITLSILRGIVDDSKFLYFYYSKISRRMATVLKSPVAGSYIEGSV